ncbi:MAG: sensor histidine kinase [Bacteroidales bacterium]|nr:sensor histidine kinase [Bacteroidales bacterium]
MKKAMGKFVSGIFCLLIVLSAHSPANASVKENDIILDLRNTEFRKDVIKLNTEWEFYWERHISPGALQDSPASPDAIVKVPSYWTEYKAEIPGIEKYGYATYRLTILVPRNIRTLAFDIPVFDSAFRIYIDGKLAGRNGLAGDKESVTRPAYSPFTYEHKVNDGEIEIVVNVSNFHHRRGGFWLPMRVGTPENINKAVSNRLLYSHVNDGILLSFALFFLIFYLLFRRNESMLFFALAIIGMLIRSVSTGSFVILSLMDLEWTTLIRLEYIGAFMALIFGALYFYKIFPDRFFRVFVIIISVLFSLSIILVIISPVSIFASAIRIFIPSVTALLIYAGAKSNVSLKKPDFPGLLNISGFVILLGGALNDIAVSRSGSMLSGKYLLAYTSTIFIFTQVVILINKWVSSFNEEQRLHKELEYVNKNLEDIVIERTSELTNQKAEVENKNKEIEKNNRILEKNLHTKDRVFSIIAHDLKSPLVNLSALIDLLKMDNPTKERDKAQYQASINEMEKQVNFTNNLIDNLLLWGEGQHSRVNYRPGKGNITDTVLSTFNLLNPLAEKKKIQMSYSHRGSPHAWYDSDLVGIIIRNLVSNAIKFTSARGIVNVMAEEVNDVIPCLRIEVSDTGSGIEPGRLQKLKSDFRLESTPGTAGEKGTGLGLQLCFDLVKINGGEMHISSKEGEGTKVSFTLPLHS